jgi:hypothetical protein
MKWVAGAIALLAVAVLIAAAWIGGEMHNQSCIAKVEAQFPVAFSEVGNGPYEPTPGFQFYGQSIEFREAQIASCSRWP